RGARAGDFDDGPSDSEVARDHQRRSRRAKGRCGEGVGRWRRVADGARVDSANAREHDPLSRSRFRGTAGEREPRRDPRERRVVTVELPGLFDLQVNGFAGGRIVLVTLAPEVAGAVRLIEHLVASGVRAAIGHTAATPGQVADAIAAGATLATHLGNGCAQMLPRHPNVIWELLAADAVLASVIVDGH